jgi:hypothetical protein
MLRALRQQAAGVLVGWSARILRDSPAPRSADGSYDGPRLVAWFVERGIEKARKEAFVETDPLLVGGMSPNLERYRAEKAREAKRRNDVEEQLLVPIERVQEELAGIGQALRVQLELLERAHGAAVGKALREAIDAAEASWRSRFGEPATVVHASAAAGGPHGR